MRPKCTFSLPGMYTSPHTALWTEYILSERTREFGTPAHTRGRSNGEADEHGAVGAHQRGETVNGRTVTTLQDDVVHVHRLHEV